MGERPDELSGPYDTVVENAAAMPGESLQNEPVYDESGTITADTYDTGAPQPVYVGDASDTYMGDVDSDNRGDDDLSATRQQIEQTRSEMSNTIDAIQNKLNPSTMVQEAKDSVRDATVGRAQDMVGSAGDTAADLGGSILETIRRNPVPAALAGISLGWLIVNRPKSTSGYSPRSYRSGRYGTGGYSGGRYRGYQSQDLDYAGRPIGGWDTDQGSDQGTVGRAAARGKEAVSNTMDQVQNTVGNTVDQVQSSVGSAVNQAQGVAGDAVSNAGDTASDIGSTIVETIRQNPIPAALTGIGLGWLITKMSSGSSQPNYSARMGGYSRYSAGYPSSYQGYQSSNWDDQPQPVSGSTIDQARQNLGQTADQVQGTVSNTVNQVQDTAGRMANQAQNTAGQMASQVQSQVSQLGNQTQQAAQQATSGFQAMMQNNPLAVGAAAVAVGLAIGLAVPETSKEDELMGDARADMTDRAQQMVQDTAQKVQTVAQEAVGAAKQEAQDQNLM